MNIRNMLIILIILLTSGILSAQIAIENIFGLENAPSRWTRFFDRQTIEIPYGAALSHPSDAANLRFGLGDNFTDIILVIDSGSGVIRWLRCRQNDGRRHLSYAGLYGLFNSESVKFNQPSAIVSTSTTARYSPLIDHIFVADRMEHRLVKLNFSYHPIIPAADRIVFEDTITVDSMFYPIDLEYVNFNTGNRNDNRLIALDDISYRLCVFDTQGDLISSFFLNEDEDSISSIYNSLACRLISSDTVAIYLADRCSAGVRLYYLAGDENISYIGYLNLGERSALDINKVVYDDRLGLLAIDSREPRLYQLADDLSHIISYLEIPDFDMMSLNYPFNLAIFPERVVIFENATESRGILSFVFNRSFRKDTPANDDLDNLPDRYEIWQNYPNPFNSSTSIKYALPEPSYVSIKVYNILGQLVTSLVDSPLPAGYHQIIWNTGDLASGMYFCKIQAGEYSQTKKMMLLK